MKLSRAQRYAVAFGLVLSTPLIVLLIFGLALGMAGLVLLKVLWDLLAED